MYDIEETVGERKRAGLVDYYWCESESPTTFSNGISIEICDIDVLRFNFTSRQNPFYVLPCF